MEVKLDKIFHEINYFTVDAKLNRFFIRDDEIYFHVEKIPVGLNFIDIIRFKSLICTSIDGFVATSYKVKEYLIFIYVKYAIKNKKSKVLLMEKVEFLKNTIHQQILSEIWIIKDTKYKCIGMYNNYPVFFMMFENSYDVNENLDAMIDNLNQYCRIDNIRFFGCKREDFIRNDINTIEYSEFFMSSLLENESSLDKYCEKNCIIRSRMNPANVALICFTAVVNVSSFILYMQKGKLLQNCSEIETSIGKISRPISKKHYEAILRSIEEEKARSIQE